MYIHYALMASPHHHRLILMNLPSGYDAGRVSSNYMAPATSRAIDSFHPSHPHSGRRPQSRDLHLPSPVFLSRTLVLVVCRISPLKSMPGNDETLYLTSAARNCHEHHISSQVRQQQHPPMQEWASGDHGYPLQASHRETRS